MTDIDALVGAEMQQQEFADLTGWVGFAVWDGRNPGVDKGLQSQGVTFRCAKRGIDELAQGGPELFTIGIALRRHRPISAPLKQIAFGERGVNGVGQILIGTGSRDRCLEFGCNLKLISSLRLVEMWIGPVKTIEGGKEMAK